MFLGQFAYQIDSKGRLTIPVRFRAALSSGAYITQGYERNLIVYTTESFNVLAERATKLSTTDPEARAVRRLIFGRANDISLDGSGRILIPLYLREYAFLDGETVVVGAGEYIEIWNADAWGKELVSVADPDTNTRRFMNFDLSAG